MLANVNRTAAIFAPQSKRCHPKLLSFYPRGEDYPLGVWNRSVRGLSESGVRSANGSLVIMVITAVRTMVARSNGAAPPALEHADRRSPQSSFSTLSRQHLTNEVGCVSVQNWTIPLPVVFAGRRGLPSFGPATPVVSHLESACSTCNPAERVPVPEAISQFERRAIPVEQEFDRHRVAQFHT